MITYEITLHNGKPNGVRAMRGNVVVGILKFYTLNGEISEIEVNPSYRRQGIATELLKRAREVNPNVRHSDCRTELGDLWARSTGDELPNLADDEYAFPF